MNLLGSLDGLVLEPLDFLQRLVADCERYAYFARGDGQSRGISSLFFTWGRVTRTLLVCHVCYSQFGFAPGAGPVDDGAGTPSCALPATTKPCEEGSFIVPVERVD